MKYKTIIQFSNSHENSYLKNKEIDYVNFVEGILKMICDPRFKELEICKEFCGFFNEKYKDPVQQAIQFQAAVDYLFKEIKGEIL